MEEHITSACSKLFTNKVGVKCSWLGRRNNFAINNLTCISVCKGSIFHKNNNEIQYFISSNLISFDSKYIIFMEKFFSFLQISSLL